MSTFKDSDSERKPLLEETHNAGRNVTHYRYANGIEEENPVANVDSTIQSADEHGLRHLPWSHKATLLMLCSAIFFAGCGFSMIAPFFPRVATDKGMTEIEFSMVFSTFELVMFIFSPIFGNFLTRLGAKFLYVSGILVGGVCSILFGTLYLCPNGLPFKIMCYAVRCVEALGLTANVTASFAIVSNLFPRHVATVFGILETAHGIGLMAGPGVGGALFEAGGFGLPFYVIGLLTIFNGLIVWKFLKPPADIGMERRVSAFSLLKSPMVLVTMLSIMAGAIGITYLDPTLSDHLEKFGIGTGTAGLIFMIGPGLYALTSPFWGYLSDKKNVQSPLIIMGNFMCCLAFILIGPWNYAPFLPFKLWVVIVGLVLYGLSIGCAIVPTMKCLIIGAVDLGFENNLDTFGVVSGLFNSMFCFGAFLGTTLGGVLVEEVGFRQGVSIISAVFLFAMVTSAMYFFIRLICRMRLQRVPTPPPDESRAYRQLLSSAQRIEEEIDGQGGAGAASSPTVLQGAQGVGSMFSFSSSMEPEPLSATFTSVADGQRRKSSDTGGGHVIT